MSPGFCRRRFQHDGKIILRSLQAVGVPEAVEAADGSEAVNLFTGEFVSC